METPWRARMLPICFWEASAPCCVRLGSVLPGTFSERASESCRILIVFEGGGEIKSSQVRTSASAAPLARRQCPGPRHHRCPICMQWRKKHLDKAACNDPLLRVTSGCGRYRCLQTSRPHRRSGAIWIPECPRLRSSRHAGPGFHGMPGQHFTPCRAAGRDGGDCV
jgi:hypothetical protein